jgi:hypothetical protein
MLMNGYHPDQVFGKSDKRDPGSSPSPDIIPSTIRYFIIDRAVSTGSSIVESLDLLYKRTEWALYSLKQCKTDPDHWYPVIPGWCPWCTPYGPFSKLLMTRRIDALAIIRSPLLLSEPEEMN